MSIQVLSGKVFVIVTGASRGIGAEIAQKFSRLLEPGSQILLLSRDVDKMKENCEKMPKHLKIDYEYVDLSVANESMLDGILKKHLGTDGVKNFDRAIIVHNAGSIGDLKKTTIEITDSEELRKYYDLNVFSPIILNGVFMKLFTDATNVKRLVINITSLCAIEPMKSLGFYGPGKAAREMFFKIFATEFPQVNVLNYSPGPVETDMLNSIIVDSVDDEIRATFRELRENKGVLTTEQTVDRLILVLRDQKYKSGDHVDYYDQL